MHRLSACAATAVALLVAACGGGAGSSNVPAAALPAVVPSGVDSTVAEAADSLADASFVAAAQADQALALQEEARLIVEHTDSMWEAMAVLLDSGRAVSPDDSVAATAAANEGGLALVRLDSLLRSGDPDMQALAAQTGRLLDSAEVALERSFGLNPFDNRTRVWLAQVYGLQARRLGQVEQYDRAIDELQKLVLLTPDQHTVWAMLANNYFYVENWDGAALNYEKAEQVYLETWDLTIDEPEPLDSTIVYSYVQAQGDMHVQRRDAVRAQVAYASALEWATTPEDSAYVEGELAWMAWDDMNIDASFARDSLLQLEQQGSLDEVRRGYAALVTTLSVRTAIDETEWRLAIVDYNLGRTEDAAERLRSLVDRTPVDSAGAPIDPAYARYFDDYGTLCMNLGRSARAEQRDNRTALKYFTQASEVVWSGRGTAYFEVARLVAANLPAALENATAAHALEDSMTVEQRLDLYRLLMDLNRRAGDFEEARRYRDAFRALRGG